DETIGVEQPGNSFESAVGVKTAGAEQTEPVAIFSLRYRVARTINGGSVHKRRPTAHGPISVVEKSPITDAQRHVLVRSVFDRFSLLLHPRNVARSILHRSWLRSWRWSW